MVCLFTPSSPSPMDVAIEGRLLQAAGARVRWQGEKWESLRKPWTKKPTSEDVLEALNAQLARRKLGEWTHLPVDDIRRQGENAFTWTEPLLYVEWVWWLVCNHGIGIALQRMWVAELCARDIDLCVDYAAAANVAYACIDAAQNGELCMDTRCRGGEVFSDDRYVQLEHCETHHDLSSHGPVQLLQHCPHLSSCGGWTPLDVVRYMHAHPPDRLSWADVWWLNMMLYSDLHPYTLHSKLKAQTPEASYWPPWLPLRPSRPLAIQSPPPSLSAPSVVEASLTGTDLSVIVGFVLACYVAVGKS